MVLEEQPWYWGDVDRNIVAHALSNQDNGSFLIRNATAPGNYTLSVRANGITRLARIINCEGKFGFVPTDIYDSVEDLVEFHKSVSLKQYNKDLDVCLVTPIPKPPPKKTRSTSGSWSKKKSITPPCTPTSSNPSMDPEWHLRLELERLRITHTAIIRDQRLHIYYTCELNKAEHLFHNYGKTVAELDRKISELSEICENQKATLRAGGMDDKTHDAIRNNNTILARSLDRIVEEKNRFQERRTRLSVIIEDLKECVEKYKRLGEGENSNKTRILSRLVDYGANHEQVTRTMVHSEEMVQREAFQRAQQLGDMPLHWDPETYLVNDSSKDYSGNLIQAAKARCELDGKQTDGIFVIRPSSSRQGHLVLDVLIGEKIVHCLIEQASDGWGFVDTKTWLCTIGDFVRYYSHESLGDHNPELKACLSCPAMEPEKT